MNPLQRLLKSFQYAFKGVQRLFKLTPNARIHLFFSIGVILGGFVLEVSRVEWLILILCIALVFSLEAINTGLERLSDQVTTQYSPLIKDAKDLAAGAVLIAAIGSAIIGIIIFFF